MLSISVKKNVPHAGLVIVRDMDLPFLQGGAMLSVHLGLEGIESTLEILFVSIIKLVCNT